METLPLVSCIMPTADRAHFIPLALKYFRRQTYPNKELIVLDDGLTPISDMLGNDSNIKYERLDKALLTGAKRNYACERSRGDIIVHLDDDDWYADDWIVRQVDVLTSGNASIAGLSSLYFYDPVKALGWKYVYPPSEKPWVAGATMAYYKDFWKKHPFKNVKIGEDNFFVWGCSSQVMPHTYINGMVAIVHRNNTSPKFTSNVRWQSVPVSEIIRAIGEDNGLYVNGLLK